MNLEDTNLMPCQQQPLTRRRFLKIATGGSLALAGFPAWAANKKPAAEAKTKPAKHKASHPATRTASKPHSHPSKIHPAHAKSSHVHHPSKTLAKAHHPIQRPRLPEPPARSLVLQNTHTDEKLSLTYFEHGRYLPDALRAVNHILRDHRTGTIHPIDPELLDHLYDLRALLSTRHKPFQIISGYRSPLSNAILHQHSKGVAVNSFHTKGQAIDIRIAGLDSRVIRDAAIALRCGGVGYYEDSDFVHLDTGHFRIW